MLRSSIGVAKVHFGSNPVSHELFEFFDVGEPALVGSRPDDFVIDTYLEHPARAGYQGELADHALERGQQLLLPSRLLEVANGIECSTRFLFGDSFASRR